MKLLCLLHRLSSHSSSSFSLPKLCLSAAPSSCPSPYGRWLLWYFSVQVVWQINWWSWGDELRQMGPAARDRFFWLSSLQVSLEISLNESWGTSFLFIPQGTEIYQAITGSNGYHAHFPQTFLECLLAKGQYLPPLVPHQIYFNCIIYFSFFSSHTKMYQTSKCEVVIPPVLPQWGGEHKFSCGTRCQRGDDLPEVSMDSHIGLLK